MVIHSCVIYLVFAVVKTAVMVKPLWGALDCVVELVMLVTVSPATGGRCIWYPNHVPNCSKVNA